MLLVFVALKPLISYSWNTHTQSALLYPSCGYALRHNYCTRQVIVGIMCLHFNLQIVSHDGHILLQNPCVFQPVFACFCCALPLTIYGMRNMKLIWCGLIVLDNIQVTILEYYINIIFVLSSQRLLCLVQHCL